MAGYGIHVDGVVGSVEVMVVVHGVDQTVGAELQATIFGVETLCNRCPVELLSMVVVGHNSLGEQLTRIMLEAVSKGIRLLGLCIRGQKCRRFDV